MRRPPRARGGAPAPVAPGRGGVGGGRARCPRRGAGRASRAACWCPRPTLSQWMPVGKRPRTRCPRAQASTDLPLSSPPTSASRVTPWPSMRDQGEQLAGPPHRPGRARWEERRPRRGGADGRRADPVAEGAPPSDPVPRPEAHDGQLAADFRREPPAVQRSCCTATLASRPRSTGTLSTGSPSASARAQESLLAETPRRFLHPFHRAPPERWLGLSRTRRAESFRGLDSVGAAGLEPTTPGFGGRYSIQMSYAPRGDLGLDGVVEAVLFSAVFAPRKDVVAGRGTGGGTENFG